MVVNFEDVKQNADNYATTFSEDDNNLKDFLLKCWDKDIETRSCCCGHNEKDFVVSFINIEKNINSIFSIVNQVYEKDFKIWFGYGLDYNENVKKMITISSNYRNLDKLKDLKFFKSESFDFYELNLLFKICFFNNMDIAIYANIENNVLSFENLLVDKYKASKIDINKKLYFNNQLDSSCFKKEGFQYVAKLDNRFDVVTTLLFLNHKANNYNGFFEPEFEKSEYEYLYNLLYGEDNVKVKSSKFLS